VQATATATATASAMLHSANASAGQIIKSNTISNDSFLIVISYNKSFFIYFSPLFAIPIPLLCNRVIEPNAMQCNHIQSTSTFLP
jgi:hypothetical protein